MGITFLTRLFNRLLMGERMPEEWRRSVLIPIYKNKRDPQCCGNYRGIKLRSHTMKVCEKIIEARLRNRVEISKQQYGFMPGKGTTDAMFALKMLIEKYRESQRELHCVFVDLECYSKYHLSFEPGFVFVFNSLIFLFDIYLTASLFDGARLLIFCYLKLPFSPRWLQIVKRLLS